MKASLKMIRDAKELGKINNESIIEGEKLQGVILRKIVELNGYEYIEMDWLDNFGNNDFSDLIDELLGNKKKVTKSST